MGGPPPNPSAYENWAALNDCLTDLIWLSPEAGYVLVITDPLLVLDAEPADFKVLVRTLMSVVKDWASPIDAGDRWDRTAIPFNVVLAVDPQSGPAVRERCRRAGAVLVDVD